MSSFDLHGFWLFGNDGTRDEEEQEKEHQEELCRLMEQYHAYMDIVKEKSYVLRGTKIGCQYGRDIVSLDMYKDNGVVWGITKFPMATIDDCRTDNIHHFGYCKCPETQYAGRLPMTKASWGDGEITEAEDGNIFPHICVPLIKKEQKWKQIDNDLLIEVGQGEAEPALLEDAVLICQYGGIISVREVLDVTEEEERPVVNLTSWLKAYKGEPDASDGTIVTYSFNDRAALRKPGRIIDWYSYEKQQEKNKYCAPYLVGQEFNKTGKGVLVDQDERYWVTLGPKVFYPEYPDDGKCVADEFKEYIGCRVDVVLQHMENEDEYIYIECVWSGNIKAHTFDNGIYQTGEPYPESSEAKKHPFKEEYVNGSIVEFTGKDPEETGDMSKYIVEYLIVYPKKGGTVMNRKSIMLFMSLILFFLVLFIGLSAYLKTPKRDIAIEDYLIEGSVVPEDRKDSEIQKEEDERSVCDIVGAMDFTAKEPQLDINSEENQIYLEGYLKVLKNRIPTIGKVEVKYYKDLWKAGIEFEQLLKEKDTREYPYLYYYDDLDGDGKPEFAINQGCMFLLKYEKEQGECRILYQTESCYFETIVGAGQIWYHDGLHADIVRDNYIGLGEDGSFQDILWLEKGINPKYLFYKVGVGGDPTYFEDVSEEEWNEITQPFFEMVENNAVPRKTLKEVFGDLLEENTEE